MRFRSHIVTHFQTLCRLTSNIKYFRYLDRPTLNDFLFFLATVMAVSRYCEF